LTAINNEYRLKKQINELREELNAAAASKDIIYDLAKEKALAIYRSGASGKYLDITGEKINS
jgi:hypothetical protein